MKAIIRKDEDAVSPVIATILMVAITVVLAAVLYVMVSGLITTPTTPSSGWGINQGKSTDGTNWTLSFTTVPSGASLTSMFLTISTGSGAAYPGATSVAFSTISGAGTSGYHAIFYTPLSGTAVSPGDVMRISIYYPSGSSVQIVSGSSVVYTHVLA